MLVPEAHELRAEIESLIEWWRDAGVDVLIDEAPRNWLAETKLVAPAVTASAPQPMTPPRQSAPVALPENLPEFLAWLASDTQTLTDYPVRQRVAPQGDTANIPMIVTDVPERDDVTTGQLLSGEVGALFDRMIGAWKIDRSAVYLTSLAPARPASGRVDAAALETLTPILRHHLRLAAPKKLWLMGEAASCAVLGMKTADAAGRLHFVNYDGVTFEAIATLHPRVLLREPKSKGRVWEDMQRLIAPTTGEDVQT